MEKTICDLFAGVGGFRLGFDRLNTGWKTTWFSQWEPGARTQWAHDCYVAHFGDSPDEKGEYHTGEDIGQVDKKNIPDHNLIVGGFPCQDYSVASTLSKSVGIEGKKGVLWWQIYRILKELKNSLSSENISANEMASFLTRVLVKFLCNLYIFYFTQS